MKPTVSTFHPRSIRRTSRTEAVGHCLLAIVLVAGLALVGFVAASGGAGSAAESVIVALCLAPLTVIELRRAILALWIIGASGPRAISRFRRQLDALPETKHPLGA